MDRWFTLGPDAPDIANCVNLFGTKAAIKPSGQIPGNVKSDERFEVHGGVFDLAMLARLPQSWLDGLPLAGGLTSAVQTRFEFTPTRNDSDFDY